MKDKQKRVLAKTLEILERSLKENKSNADRCPVNTYLAYKKHQPTSMMTDESPFYLAVNNKNPKPGQTWFKCPPLGVNSLRSTLKNMIRDSDLETDKKTCKSQHKKAFGSEVG